ncbi:MAG: phytanoyl-CoA dioxygenase family protein [Verrucomicrobiia bacterium]|jgi:non-heme Fe2+,alpha-ketoglutarate-dependent halogenase
MIDVDAIGNPTTKELAALNRELGFQPIENHTPRSLSVAQITHYNERGYLMPFAGLAEEELQDLRGCFDRILKEALDRGDSSYSINTAHLRFGKIYDLMAHPAIMAPVRDLLGDDVIGWGAHFFCKLPRDGKRVPWHQDCIYWPLTPTTTVTVWLAIDDATPENANMRFIPRSHLHGPIEFDTTNSDDDVLNLSVNDATSHGDAPVDVSLPAGQFSLHSDLLLHGSEANESDRRRSGLTLRYAAADVRAHHGWHQKGIIVNGQDRDKHWQNAPRPED